MSQSKLFMILLATVFFSAIPHYSLSNDTAKNFTQDEKLADDNPNLVMESTYKIMGRNGTVGTAFFVKPPIGSKCDGKNVVLVTAAHVVEDMKDEYALLFLRKKDGDRYSSMPWLYRIGKPGKPFWLKHPESDVAVMPISFPEGITSESIPFEKLATDTTLKSFECFPGRNVKILGYPLNVQSSSAGFSVLRTGDISSYPLTPSKELKTFLVDFRVFGGNSGGPVYFNEADWPKNSNLDTPMVYQYIRNIIIGLVSEQISIEQTENTINQRTTYSYPLSIAKAVHSELIRDSIELLLKNNQTTMICNPVRDLSFIGKAVERLEKENVPDKTLENVKANYSKWETNPTDENWERVYDDVTFSHKGYNVESLLSIDSKPKSGATVKYQTARSKMRNEPPVSANQLTRCKTTVAIGCYHIWTERNGKKTSDDDQIFTIVNPEESIELDEYTK